MALISEDVKWTVPRYPVATLPNASFVVTVMSSVNPAVMRLGLPVTVREAAAAGRAVAPICTFMVSPGPRSTNALSAFAPVTVPRVQLPTRATPVASVVGVAPATLPPPAVTAKVTPTPGTGLLSASRTTTLGAVANARPTTAACPSPSLMASEPGGPASAVAPAVTNESANAAAIRARMDCGPLVGPNFHWTSTRPESLVTPLSGVISPPPDTTLNLTFNPATPRLSAALTRNRTGWPNRVATWADWLLPDSTAARTGTGCTCTPVVSAGPVINVAVIGAGPRCAAPTTLPWVMSGTRARSVSSEPHAMGVPGITVPLLSSASATRVTVSPKNTAEESVTIRTDAALAPTPTYTTVTGMAGGAPPAELGVTVVGPAWNAVSPAGVMRDNVKRNVSDDVSIGTLSERSTESVPGAIVITVSSAMELSDVRRSSTRNRSISTMPATELSNCGARENCPRNVRGPLGSSKQLKARNAASRRNGASSVARRSWRAIRSGSTPPGQRPDRTYDLKKGPD